MLLEYAREILGDAEAAASVGNTEKALACVRRLSLDDFGLLMLNMPNSAYPGLSRMLPRMAADKIQDNWTGSHGLTLLKQSVNFVRAVHRNYETETQKSLSDARILDFGCGYGRLLRLMMLFAKTDSLFGCDPWDESIRICREDGIDCTLEISDYLPTSLPFAANSMDLIYAFSVFTHTSLRATKCALDALRTVVSPSGLLVITIRPLEYWDMDQRYAHEKELLKQTHKDVGFVFRPHNREAVDGDITYGDTSMTFDFLESITPSWKIDGYDRSLDDPYQILVYLKPT